jgi:adenylate cyclase
VALCLAVGIRVADPPPVEDARLRAFDVLTRLSPRVAPAAPAAVVDFDDDTLQRLGHWPWPRTRMAALVNRLHVLGAGPIVFDIVFAEPDRTSPANVIPLWPSTPEVDALRAGTLGLPDHDRILAEALGHSTAITGFALLNATLTRQDEPMVKAAVLAQGPDPSGSIIPLKGAIASLRLFEEAAAGNGHLTILAERDGAARRVPLLLRSGDQLYPSVVAEALRVAQGASHYVVNSRQTAAGRAELTGIRIGPLSIPTDAHGVAWVYYAKPLPARTIPVWRVLAGAVEPEALRGRMVFIGTSAASLRDLRSTPLQRSVAGVEVHAQLADQLRSGIVLSRPRWADAAETSLLAVAGLVVLLLLRRAGMAAAGWAAAGLTLLVGLCSWTVFTRWRLLLDPAVPAAGTLAVWAVGSLTRLLRREAERLRVRRAFSRHLSPERATQLARHPERLRLGGETRTMTVLAADIRGFAALAERFDAAGLSRFMRRFLTPMTAIIHEWQGTVDKYVGDRVTAFWNAPLDDPDHPRHAARAALAMRRHLVRLNQELREAASRRGSPFRPVLIGIGIATGECAVGNFGSAQRFDYSVLGEPVVLADRLQRFAKTYGTDILLGETAAAALPDCAILELDLVRLSGRAASLRLFALLGDEVLGAEEPFHTLRAAHRRLLEAYRGRRWDEARAAVDECVQLDTNITRLRVLYHLYAQRLDACHATPPADGWDGTWELPSVA